MRRLRSGYRRGEGRIDCRRAGGACGCRVHCRRRAGSRRRRLGPRLRARGGAARRARRRLAGGRPAARARRGRPRARRVPGRPLARAQRRARGDDGAPCGVRRRRRGRRPGLGRGRAGRLRPAGRPDAVFGPVAPRDDRGLPYCTFEGGEHLLFRERGTPPWTVGTGGNMAFRRDVLEAAGGFDTRFGIGGPAQSAEELDAIMRLLRAGRTLAFSPELPAYHPTKTEQEHLASRWSYGFGMGALFRRHRSPLLAARYLLTIVQTYARPSAQRDRPPAPGGAEDLPQLPCRPLVPAACGVARAPARADPGRARAAARATARRSRSRRRSATTRTSATRCVTVSCSTSSGARDDAERGRSRPHRRACTRPRRALGRRAELGPPGRPACSEPRVRNQRRANFAVGGSGARSDHRAVARSMSELASDSQWSVTSGPTASGGRSDAAAASRTQRKAASEVGRSPRQRAAKCSSRSSSVTAPARRSNASVKK